ncbi:MAG: hypothetical protein IJL83_06085 [Clostridia bacterium]|nr:hypothetical protein [Clostridia bacterium]
MKKRVLIIILLSLFLVLFNAMFFLLGGHEGANASRWISYGAIHLSYLLMIFSPLIVRGVKSDKIFGFPLATVSMFYFCIEFIVGLIFILFNPEGWKAAFLVQLVLFVIYATLALVVLIAGATADEAEKEKVAPGVFVNKAGELLADAIKRAREGEARDAVNAAAFALSQTPAFSREEVLGIEGQIVSRIKDLRVAAEKKDDQAVIAISGDVRGMIEQRTAMLSQMPVAQQ